jgi:hypothetical protein
VEHNFHIPQFEEIKAHVKKHTTKYAVGTSIVITAGVTYFVTRRFSVQTISIAPVFNNTVAPVMNNVTNNVGRCSKIVMDLETEQLWKKINLLAEELSKEYNVPLETVRQRLSKHLNGYPGYENVFGRKYVTAGLSTG